jgi:drug/metabolite transporter (DMT)-like permease
VAAISFAAGSVLSRRFRFHVDTFALTTWQIGAASVVNLTLAVAAGNFQTAVWTRTGVLSVVYLAVFGSVVGLTAYVYLLKHVPVTKVSTYAFVNPVIAVLIGVVAFHEHLAPAELAGMVLIIAAVAMVILSRTKAATMQADPMLEVPIEE